MLQIPNALGVDGARVGPVVGTDAPPHYRCLAEALAVTHKVLVGIAVAADSLNISGLCETTSGLTVLEHVCSEERRDFFARRWVFAEDLGENEAVTDSSDITIWKVLGHASYFAPESLALLNYNSLRRGCCSLFCCCCLVGVGLRGGRCAGHDDVANQTEAPDKKENMPEGNGKPGGREEREVGGCKMVPKEVQRNGCNERDEDADDEDADEDENGGENCPDNLVHDFSPKR